MLEPLKMVFSFFVLNIGSLFIALDLATHAQVIPNDPLAGNSGWVGTGLLGAVLSWLLFVHLPAKDKQIKELTDIHARIEADQRTTHTATESTQREAHLKVESAQRDTFEKTMKVMTDHCKEEFDRILNHYTNIIHLRADENDLTKGTADEVKSRTQRDSKKTQMS